MCQSGDCDTQMEHRAFSEVCSPSVTCSGFWVYQSDDGGTQVEHMAFGGVCSPSVTFMDYGCANLEMAVPDWSTELLAEWVAAIELK
jgi:hypothetical protein